MSFIPGSVFHSSVLLSSLRLSSSQTPGLASPHPHSHFRFFLGWTLLLNTEEQRTQGTLGNTAPVCVEMQAALEKDGAMMGY